MVMSYIIKVRNYKTMKACKMIMNFVNSQVIVCKATKNDIMTVLHIESSKSFAKECFFHSIPINISALMMIRIM
ncbi:unnamed protein product [Rotaria sordida]|uniref:Uncharacterized protein n=1 Tax=Rotaria sordida TaxID=392033 RepID=A0A814VTZ6_9BILA|nr:unnamed protein product [Rotaria sordida]CAF1461173.1 unnamed protein product [Rotaria sordida]